jgi:GT2 family glycosyltransferase
MKTPEFEFQGDWATNPLSTDLSVTEMAARIAAHSARLYPRLPFLNGFCLFIKRQLIENIGIFYEILFPQGYEQHYGEAVVRDKLKVELIIN